MSDTIRALGIYRYLDVTNEDPKPFAWTKTADEILASVAPLLQAYFGYMTLASKLISHERSSNRLDIAYLFYLPFCMMFVSTDRLHQRCAPLFLRPDQEFVWGPDLKANLRQINEHYLKLPDFAGEEGVLSLTDDPTGNRRRSGPQSLEEAPS